MLVVGKASCLCCGNEEVQWLYLGPALASAVAARTDRELTLPPHSRNMESASCPRWNQRSAPNDSASSCQPMTTLSLGGRVVCRAKPTLVVGRWVCFMSDRAYTHRGTSVCECIRCERQQLRGHHTQSAATFRIRIPGTPHVIPCYVQHPVRRRLRRGNRPGRTRGGRPVRASPVRRGRRLLPDRTGNVDIRFQHLPVAEIVMYEVQVPFPVESRLAGEL